MMTLIASLLSAQSEGENIVPNPGFEQYSAVPLGWFYTGSDFTRTVKYWESPTAASPDVYGPKVYVPTQWQEQGFGSMSPFEGKSFVGITVYGCKEGKPHCREYIQIQLSEPLVVGQRYEISYAVSHLPRSQRIGNIGCALTMERQYDPLDKRLEIEPVISPTDIVDCSNGKWLRIKGEFHAKEPASYLIIGNFDHDAGTIRGTARVDKPLQFGYYYIDEVILKKLPPIIETAPAVDLSAADLSPGDTIQLKNIYFDHDRADFLPRSYLELDALTDLMIEAPDMIIEVHGHTDNVGSDEYNYTLSIDRANAVVNYLVDKGVSRERLSARGFGSTAPIDVNNTEHGRRENRRVEFIVVSRS
jgi:outer membrane protein OmpA-like peptidoglycan-associated protein